MQLSRLVVLLFALPAAAQTYNSNAGGWNTGYGTVYGSFGTAMATQNIYNTMQLNMQRSMMRQAMIKKFGLAAVEKAEREAKSGKAPSEAGLQVSAPPAPIKGVGKFKPAKTSSVAKQIGDALGSTPEEKAALTAIVKATREAFEAQPETKAWRNDVAGALAFFIIGTATIAQDAPEPTDEVSDALFQSLQRAIDESPDFAKATNQEKQQLYETLIGFVGIPLAVYSEAKDSGDAASVKTSKELAGRLLELVLKVDAAKVKLTP